MDSFKPIRRVVLLLLVLGFGHSGAARNQDDAQSPNVNHKVDTTHLPPTYVPPGKQLYREHCASCHGSDGKGGGPVASSLSTRPPDLTTLAKRHVGAFPEQYVTTVLRFGTDISAHGSSEMPVWGPIFEFLEHYNEEAVRRRIENLCGYLKSIQEK
jgi:mono/diheme cytochrome c family protein